MIQRIQTLWLLFAAGAGFASLKLPFYSGHRIDDPSKQYAAINATNPSMLLLVLTVAVAIASLVIIFLYKDRKMQMRLIIVTLLLSLVNIVLYFLQIKKFIPAESNYDVTCIFAFIIPVFLFLAWRGVYRDQKLIRSVDRLR
jgi:hypothetical protein